MMKNNPPPIRSHIQNLLKDPATMARWETLILGAAQRTEWLERLVHTPPGFGLFATFSNVARGSRKLEVKLRRHGVELGTIRLNPQNTPKFRLKKPGESSPLNAVFDSIRKANPADDWPQLVRGCDWRSDALGRFLARIRERQLPDSIKEQMLEDALVQSFARNKTDGKFWFDHCALAEPQVAGQVFPFKFALPIIVEQEKTEAIKSGQWDKLINPTEDYGAPDILVRCKMILSATGWRLGVVELKKERPNHAAVALLQGFAYAVAIAELQRIYSNNQPVRAALRTLLGFTKPRPATIPLAVYALVEERDVLAVKEKNPLTAAVLSECGEILVGILGYKLCKDTNEIKLTSAAQWTGGIWNSIEPDAPRKSVNLVA